MSSFQFHRKRKKEVKDKIEVIKTYLYEDFLQQENINNETKWNIIFEQNRKIIIIKGIHDENIIDKEKLCLLTLIELLEWINSDKNKSIIVYTKSVYLVNIIKEWLTKWKRNDFFMDTDIERPYANLLRRINDLIDLNTITAKLVTSDNSDLPLKLKLLS